MTYELVLAMHSTYDSYERIRAIRARILLHDVSKIQTFYCTISYIMCVHEGNDKNILLRLL